MRGRAAGFAPADRSIVEHDHGFAQPPEKICDGQSRDTGSDDANVSVHVGPEGREGRQLGGRGPERRGVGCGCRRDCLPRRSCGCPHGTRGSKAHAGRAC